MHSRRDVSRALAITCLTVVSVVCFSGLALSATKLWECNRCHQQYQGNTPPAFAKCPATENKQNHWWIQKH